MRVTSLVRKLIGIESLGVKEVAFEGGGLLIRVCPRWQKPRCGVCRRQAPGYDRQPERRWRHLAIGRLIVWLLYAPRRVDCPRCKRVIVEQVPWASDSSSRFSTDFEEYVAYLAQVMDKTQVTKLTGIAWRTVGSIVERVVKRRRDPAVLDVLERIGIDEFSYRKRHHYVTIVVDHDRKRIVWGAEGKRAETLDAFFKELGLDRCHRIKEVTIDLSGAFRKSVTDWLPQAMVIFDRFHVQKLATDALDEVRRSIVRELDEVDEAEAVKKSRFALLRNPWDLSRTEKMKLREIQRTNRPLYRAYLLKEMLARALDYVQPKRAHRTLKEWIAWAARSRLKPFVRVARTVRAHFDGIMAYVKTRLTNGYTEGINTKARVVTRRAYGFHSAPALIAMLFLTCGGIHLDPPIP